MFDLLMNVMTVNECPPLNALHRTVRLYPNRREKRTFERLDFQVATALPIQTR